MTAAEMTATSPAEFSSAPAEGEEDDDGGQLPAEPSTPEDAGDETDDGIAQGAYSASPSTSSAADTDLVPLPL
jgi:hypothetical protein